MKSVCSGHLWPWKSIGRWPLYGGQNEWESSIGARKDGLYREVAFLLCDHYKQASLYNSTNQNFRKIPPENPVSGSPDITILCVMFSVPHVHVTTCTCKCTSSELHVHVWRLQREREILLYIYTYIHVHVVYNNTNQNFHKILPENLVSGSPDITILCVMFSVPHVYVHVHVTTCTCVYQLWSFQRVIKHSLVHIHVHVYMQYTPKIL